MCYVGYYLVILALRINLGPRLVKLQNKLAQWSLLFISITRSSGLEVVICRNATLNFLEPENIYSPMLISGLESHIPDFSLLGLLHFLSFSDLSYNELEQLPPKAFYEIFYLEEL